MKRRSVFICSFLIDFFRKGDRGFPTLRCLRGKSTFKTEKEDEKIRVNDGCGLLLGDSAGARGLERDAGGRCHGL